MFFKNTSEGWPIYSDNEMYNFSAEWTREKFKSQECCTWKCPDSNERSVVQLRNQQNRSENTCTFQRVARAATINIA